ncbi:hypothetical protein MMC14_005948 [Varicellaria rhodocarpa]|nr:hypothetical protein [Varicellaria rhodocarpa]
MTMLLSSRRRLYHYRREAAYQRHTSSYSKASVIPKRNDQPACVSQVPSSTKSFPFLALPGEIRNQIYALLFEPREMRASEYVSNRGEIISEYTHLGYHSITRQRKDPNISEDSEEEDKYTRYPARNKSCSLAGLLRVSRQVYVESYGFLYASCTFRFSDRQTLFMFLNTMSPAAKATIKTLQIDCMPFWNHDPYELRRYEDRVRWEHLLERVSKDLPGLEEIKFWIMDEAYDFSGERLLSCVEPPKLKVSNAWLKFWLSLSNGSFKSVNVLVENAWPLLSRPGRLPMTDHLERLRNDFARYLS